VMELANCAFTSMLVACWCGVLVAQLACSVPLARFRGQADVLR
jgi:hypothetical protein